MDVLVLIDKLDDLVHGASTFPRTDKVMIDRDQIYELLDQMRATIPEEIKQARWIVKERQEMLSEAKQEAERLLAQAQDRAEKLPSAPEGPRLRRRAAAVSSGDARPGGHHMRRFDLHSLRFHDASEVWRTLPVAVAPF